MSPKRPRSHLNADLSVTRIQEAFLSMGWTVEILNQDYGEDLLVRIFDDENATPYTFYVQAKSTDRTRKRGGDHVRYAITFDHLQHWTELWDPVFLMLWEKESGNVLWDMIQQPSTPIDTSGKKAKVLIPRCQTLNPEGLENIRAKTISRHQRLAREQSATDALVSLLKEATGADVQYDANAGIMSITEENGRPSFVFFGHMQRIVDALCKGRGVSVEELLEIAITQHAEATTTLRSGKPYNMTLRDGRTLRFSSEDELNTYLDRDIYE
jgi:hypothetical protein